MVKVLHKAMDILEYIGRDPETSKPLGRIAGDLGLNQPTCARILKTLVDRHYVCQSAPRGGYTLGPMSYSLSSGGVYRNEITHVAAPIVAQCARQIGEYVTAASYFRGKRYILATANGNPELQIRTDTDFFDDIYASATGRLLLAFEPPQAVEAHIQDKGLPGPLWKKINSKAALQKELAGIREEGFYIDLDREQLVAFAYPLCDGADVVASLGVAMLKSRFHGKHKTTVLQAARRSAEEITAGINKDQRNEDIRT